MRWARFTIEVIVIIVFIKFILFPFTGFLLGVQIPLVAVVSESMQHPNDGLCNYWNMSASTIFPECNYPFQYGLNIGDIVLLKSSENMKIGDVLVFKADSGSYIIHRIVSLSPLATMGDSNEGMHDFETDIREDQIVGVAGWKAPYLGYPSVWLTKIVEQTT